MYVTKQNKDKYFYIGKIHSTSKSRQSPDYLGFIQDVHNRPIAAEAAHVRCRGAKV
jgi:hypothetical protein